MATIIVGFMSAPPGSNSSRRASGGAGHAHMRETKFVGMEHFGTRARGLARCRSTSWTAATSTSASSASGMARGSPRPSTDRPGSSSALLHLPQEARPGQGHGPDLVALEDSTLRHHLIRPPFTSPEQLAYYVTSDLHRWLFDEYLAPRPGRAAQGRATAASPALLATVQDPGALDLTPGPTPSRGFVLASGSGASPSAAGQGGSFVYRGRNHQARMRQGAIASEPQATAASRSAAT